MPLDDAECPNDCWSLDLYAFSDLDEVRDVSTRWLWNYNHERPHLSLDRQPPATSRQWRTVGGTKKSTPVLTVTLDSMLSKSWVNAPPFPSLLRFPFGS